MQGIDDALIDKAADVTDGFSGRELAKLVASMQVCFASKDLVWSRGALF